MGNEELSAKEREDKALRRLRYLVQLTERILRQEDLSLLEAIRHVEGVKQRALELFPGEETAWTLLYEPRFRRILRRRWDYVPNDSHDLVN